MQTVTTTKAYHIHIDPLKKSMAMYNVDAVGLWQADSYTAIKKINIHLSRPEYANDLKGLRHLDSATSREQSHSQLLSEIAHSAIPTLGSNTLLTAAFIAAQLKRSVVREVELWTYLVDCVLSLWLLRETLPVYIYIGL
ncbi:uncharacterized protein Z519_08957 [Cladophialophora bantiana CBS 173.52]|uniref:Uncharacterized protein n=1 Tax=Cladophialophora bantiana (strain ATCC 10958 / CBS 173.52 / CDC B-1940 / NIH 8579) TaxID=1442370 RepID=A0A0D2HAL0_CLAB1|nr:uncharacterized protein Z519_08957 [Cladophialophora bantiana CBS 173.52]KIW90313.1 hypothetical protein Z519_08957 [Cladophialophora bantiana CBS 173.52]